MLKVRVFLLISFTKLITSFQINSIKCCSLNQQLASNGTDIFCTEFKTNQSQISGRFYEDISVCVDECIDFFKIKNENVLVKLDCESKNYTVIKKYKTEPKCCPDDHVYDTDQHGCIQDFKMQNSKSFKILKVGLSHCPFDLIAIVDYIGMNFTKNSGGDLILSNGKIINENKYCFDLNQKGLEVIRSCESYYDTCMESFDDSGIRCLRKCCPDGFLFIGTSCKPGYKSGLVVSGKIEKNKDDPNYAIIQSSSGSKYIANEKHDVTVNEFGIFYIRKSKRKSLPKDKSYCVESIDRNGVPVQEMFIFQQTVPIIEKFKYSYIILLISCVFFFLTQLVYLLLPEMQNLYGKSIINYCLVSIIGYGILAYGQGFYSQLLCKYIAYGIIFFFLCSFAWLNIICYDMWSAFGSLKVHTVPSKRKTFLKMLYYCLYAYGVPTLITLITFLFEIFTPLPDGFNPNLSGGKCFFQKVPGTYDHIIFFITPLTIMILVNCILFIRTLRYCFQVKNEINKMKDSQGSDKAKRTKIFQADREKLIMLSKLFIIMGISWLFEVVSSIIQFDESDVLRVIETIWDLFNCMQGIFVFCIFILKKKVLQSLQKKICSKVILRQDTEISCTTMSTELVDSKKKRKISETKNNLLK